MRHLPGQRHVRATARVNGVPDRWRVAIKTGLTSVVLLGGTLLAGRLDVGMLATLGAFSVLYGAGAPALLRAKILACVGIGLTASVAVGALTAATPWLDVLALTMTASVATFICVTLRVGPPGAVFFVLVHGVAGLAMLHGTPTPTIIGSAALGAAAGFVGGMSDLVVRPRRIEKAAVEGADRAVQAFAEVQDEAGVPAARHAAAVALHRGWIAVTDAGSPSDLSARLVAIQQQYTAAGARTVGVELGLQESPWGSVGDEDGLIVDGALDDAVMPDPDPHAATAPQTTAPTGHRAPTSPCPARTVYRDAAPGSRRGDDTTDPVNSVAGEQIRDTSLGRPSAGRVVRQALRWPSEPLLVVARITVAVFVAAGVARLLGVAHGHWAAAVATLILHQGGTRDAQTVRGVQRFIGTLVGLGFFIALSSADLHGWALVILVAVLQFAIEMVVVVNYGGAVMLITPLALTIGQHAGTGAHPVALSGERILDTVVALAVAFAVLHGLFRGLDVPMLRSYARQVVHGIDAVLQDIAGGRVDTDAARENRRLLYVSVLESEEMARRTHADGGARVAPYREMEATLSQLGYLVLGLAWHPDTRRAHDLGVLARGPIDRILAHPVRQERPASDIHADVRDLHTALTTWRPDSRMGD